LLDIYIAANKQYSRMSSKVTCSTVTWDLPVYIWLVIFIPGLLLMDLLNLSRMNITKTTGLK